MYHFFVEKDQVREETVLILGSDVNHIKNVLRMEPGDEIAVCTGDDREYLCRIMQISPEAILCRIEDVHSSFRELPSEIYLFQGIPKGDKMETIIQKAVELGACGLIPVEMKRSVVKLTEKKKEERRLRWQAIAQSAAKQSGRGRIPRIFPVMTWREALEFSGRLDRLLLPYEEAKDMKKTRTILSGILPGQSIGVFIGPEGGFTPDEVSDAEKKGAQEITLGKRILRTETAGMTILSILMYLLEEQDVPVVMHTGA